MDTLMGIVETPCLPCLSVEENYIWDINDLITSPFISKALPIFTLELNMNNEGSFYSTKMELFEVICVLKTIFIISIFTQFSSKF